jgi:hypothetical protein
MESRRELASFLASRSWTVRLLNIEADVAIARDCGPGDVVLSRDSDMFAYQGIAEVWRPVRGKTIQIYDMPQVLAAIHLSRAQLTTLAVVSTNDYSRNIPTLGCLTNFGIVKDLKSTGKAQRIHVLKLIFRAGANVNWY